MCSFSFAFSLKDLKSSSQFHSNLKKASQIAKCEALIRTLYHWISLGTQPCNKAPAWGLSIQNSNGVINTMQERLGILVIWPKVTIRAFKKLSKNAL